MYPTNDLRWKLIRSTWQEIFHETAVNWGLICTWRETGALARDSCLSKPLLAAPGKRFEGTVHLGALVRGHPRHACRRLQKGDLYCPFLVLPVILLGRMAVNVLKKRRCVVAFLEGPTADSRTDAELVLGRS